MLSESYVFLNCIGCLQTRYNGDKRTYHDRGCVPSRVEQMLEGDAS